MKRYQAVVDDVTHDGANWKRLNVISAFSDRRQGRNRATFRGTALVAIAGSMLLIQTADTDTDTDGDRRLYC
jgi:hypothetical protein